MRTANPDSPTKEKMMKAASNLMIAKGYVATTVDEICHEAKVTKGSFFHYFRNKEDLGRQLLKCCTEVGQKKMEEALSDLGDDPLKRLYGYADFFIKMSRDPETKGCLVGTLSQEIAETHPELRSICECNFTNLAGRFRKDLVQARNAYPPKVDFDVNSLSDYFVALYQGSLMLVKAKQDRNILEKNMIHLKQHIRCLFGK